MNDIDPRFQRRSQQLVEREVYQARGNTPPPPPVLPNLLAYNFLPWKTLPSSTAFLYE